MLAQQRIHLLSIVSNGASIVQTALYVSVLSAIANSIVIQSERLLGYVITCNDMYPYIEEALY